MQFSVLRGLILVHGLGLMNIAAADDAASVDDAAVAAAEEPALPGVVDITPANVQNVLGVNRAQEGNDHIISLLNLSWRFGPDLGDVIPDITDDLFGEGVLDVRGPLSGYMPPHDHNWEGDWGASMLVADRAAAAETLQAPDDVVDGQVFDAVFWPDETPLQIAFRGDQILFAYPRGFLQEHLDAPTLAEEFTEDERARLLSCDLVAIRRRSNQLSYTWSWLLPPEPKGPFEELTEEQQAQERIRQLGEGVEWLTSGITVEFDDAERHDTSTLSGASYHAGVFFDHAADSDGAALLAELSTGDQHATLAGLPAGDPFLVFAGALAGEDSHTYYRQLAELGGRYWTQRLRLQDSLSGRQFFGIMEEVSEHAHGFRFAAYRNPEPNGIGAYSIVLIADADEPEALIQELQQMMRLARADEVDGDVEPIVTDAEIEALVRSLGDRLYRVRRDATNRLLVVGTRATPFLEAALADDSLELRTRASVILDHFAALRGDDANHFFGSDLLQQLDPDFRYVIAGETLSDGTPVDWISVTVPEESQPHEPQLEAWLGPDWDRWRVVRTEDHVAICIGSRPGLLTETLASLSQQAQSQLQVAGWSEGEHQFVVHFDAIEIVPDPRERTPLPPGETAGLTSIGMTISPRRPPLGRTHAAAAVAAVGIVVLLRGKGHAEARSSQRKQVQSLCLLRNLGFLFNAQPQAPADRLSLA